MRLDELGERAIIRDLLRPRYGGSNWNFGSDCAATRVSANDGQWLVATTDPCPVPAAQHLGFDDYYYWGWLLGTINLSDIAAAGAKPIGLLSSLILPGAMKVSDFSRLLDGLDDCCNTAGAEIIGGNLKEGDSTSISATALGLCDTHPMSREGAKPGDAVCVVGSFGEFWAGYLHFSRNRSLMQADLSSLSVVLTPEPMVAVGESLRRSGIITACTDNSDGLYPSLVQLCADGRLGIQVDWGNATYSDFVTGVSAELDVEPERLALGWGDWNLVVTVSRNDIHTLLDICSTLGVRGNVLGEVTAVPGVRVVRGDSSGLLLDLDSQRFASDSWFTAGIESYINKLLTSPLVSPE